MSNIGDQSDIVPSDMIYLITLFIGKNWVNRLRIQPICHILSVIFSTLICNTLSSNVDWLLMNLLLLLQVCSLLSTYSLLYNNDSWCLNSFPYRITIRITYLLSILLIEKIIRVCFDVHTYIIQSLLMTEQWHFTRSTIQERKERD